MWTVIVEKDPDRDDTGTVTAIWNKGEPDEYIFSHRGERTEGEIARFVYAAQAGLAENERKRGIEAEVSREIEALLNGGN